MLDDLYDVLHGFNVFVTFLLKINQLFLSIVFYFSYLHDISSNNILSIFLS